MKKIFITLFVFTVLTNLNSLAQIIYEEENKPDIVSLGFGLGLDYGGIGANLIVYPQKNIGIFGGVGYALAGAGYNAGIKVRMITKRGLVNPFFIGMYGYNLAYKIKGLKRADKLFYGYTFGGGIDLKFRPTSPGYWTFGLLIPIRDSEYKNHNDYYQSHYNIEKYTEPLPFAITVGYKIILN